MDKAKNKAVRRTRRHRGARKRLLGIPARPRLAVYKSLNHIYAQVIDDLKGHTLASASTAEKGILADGVKPGNSAAAASVGKAIAQRAKEAGVDAVVFDRCGFRYHGRVKALADSARKEGLKF